MESNRVPAGIPVSQTEWNALSPKFRRFLKEKYEELHAFRAAAEVEYWETPGADDAPADPGVRSMPESWPGSAEGT